MQLKHSFIITFILLTSGMSSIAQNLVDQQSFLKKTDFKIGYYGNLLWSNGINIGGEYLFKERLKTKQRKKRDKTISKQLLFNGTVGYSTNFSTETEDGLSLYFGIALRRKNHKGKFLNLELNPLGYYRSFLPETYLVENNKVSKVSLPGRGYYSPSIAFGIGKYREGKTRTGWYFNLRYSLRTPYNAGSLGLIFLEYGHRFNFKNK